jgi:hypothetical protein
MSWLKSGWRVAEGWACQAGEWAGLVQPREEVEVPRSAFVRETEGGKEREQRQEQGPGMLGRLFGGITRQPGGREVRRGLPPPGTYKVGEVRADYVKVSCNPASPECEARFHHRPGVPRGGTEDADSAERLRPVPALIPRHRRAWVVGAAPFASDCVLVSRGRYGRVARTYTMRCTTIAPCGRPDVAQEMLCLRSLARQDRAIRKVKVHSIFGLTRKLCLSY